MLYERIHIHKTVLRQWNLVVPVDTIKLFESLDKLIADSSRSVVPVY